MKGRTVAVTVKMTQADLDRFLDCRSKNWPEVPLSRSSLVLMLARLGCDRLEEIAKEEKKKPKG
jgi:hypothetical protein